MRVEFTVSNMTVGNVTPFTASTRGTLRTVNGTYIENLVVTGFTNFFLQANSTFDGSIDNVSVKEVISDSKKLNKLIMN